MGGSIERFSATRQANLLSTFNPKGEHPASGTVKTYEVKLIDDFGLDARVVTLSKLEAQRVDDMKFFDVGHGIPEHSSLAIVFAELGATHTLFDPNRKRGFRMVIATMRGTDGMRSAKSVREIVGTFIYGHVHPPIALCIEDWADGSVDWEVGEIDAA